MGDFVFQSVTKLKKNNKIKMSKRPNQELYESFYDPKSWIGGGDGKTTLDVYFSKGNPFPLVTELQRILVPSSKEENTDRIYLDFKYAGPADFWDYDEHDEFLQDLEYKFSELYHSEAFPKGRIIEITLNDGNLICPVLKLCTSVDFNVTVEEGKVPEVEMSIRVERI